VVATLVQAGATPAATVSDLVACLVADFAESSTARVTASPVREPGVLHQQVDATRRAFSRADALRSVAQAYLRATGPIVRRSVTTASSDQEPPSRVYPPNGRVRVAAPLAVSDAAVRVAIIGRLRWIGVDELVSAIPSRRLVARCRRAKRRSCRQLGKDAPSPSTSPALLHPGYR